MTDTATTARTASRRRRPVLITIAIVFVYLSGLGNTALGVLVLLSRYDVQGDPAIVTASLVGAAITLLGLLTIAGASGLSRASRFARILITIYLGVQSVLHLITIIEADAWDWIAAIQTAMDLFVIIVLWLPVGMRYFRATPAGHAAAPAS